MVQVVDHLGTMDVKDSNGNDQTLEQWYEGYLENNTLPAPVSDELKHDTLDTDLYHKGFQDQESDVQVSNDLCEKCQNLANNLVTMLPHIEEEGAGPQFIPQYSSCHEFYVRSRAGCHSCKVLMQLVQDRFMYFLKAERRLRYLKEEWAINLILKEQTTPERHLKLFINLPGIEVPMYWFGNDLTLSQTEDIFFSNEKIPISVPASTSDATATALELASQWLTMCLETHGDSCNKHAVHQVPTRLIAVNDTPIRLVTLSESKVNPRYTTLSHIWGKLDFIKLTIDSLNSFMEEIPIEKLTKTIKDAVQITQRLGINYLWVDSLCIIQDSKEDWEIESFSMGSVYGGSTLNIAAASAIDGSKGCFLELPTYQRKIRLETTVAVEGRIQKYDLAAGDLYHSGTESHALGYRGWAFQERILARRTIHFSNSGVFWECMLRDACDIFPDGLPQAFKPIAGHMKNNPLSLVWTQIIDKYSFSNLTYQSDRLVALSGIARAVQIETEDQYVAGMWRKNLEFQLCWNLFTTAPQRSPDYRAPTWSWASLDTNNMVGVYYGEITPSQRNFTLLAHVVEVSVTPSGQNPLGNLSSAYLKITCKGMLSGPFDNKKSSWWGRHLRSFELLELPETDSLLLISLDCDEVIPEILYVLPLVQKRIDDGELVAGLIIAPTAGPKGEFRRYGSFVKTAHREDEEELASLEAFLRAWNHDGPATAASVCIEQDPAELEARNEKFVLTLI